MICYHHNDLDGKAAAWLVHMMKPQGTIDYPVSYISTGYNDKLNKHQIKDDVVIVDISISEETYSMFLEVCNTARTVTWIDHHKTSEEVVAKHLEELQSIRNLTYFVSSCASGAALTYTFFSLPKGDLHVIRNISEKEYYKIDATCELITSDAGNKTRINAVLTKYQKDNEAEGSVYQYEYNLPKWVAHVDDYDCWKKMYPETEAIFLGIESEYTEIASLDRNYFNTFWEEITNNEEEQLESYNQSGSNVKKYLEARYDRELSDSFEWEFKDIKFLCKNGTGNSWNFGSKIKDYKAVILFNYAGSSGKWEYSVYSDESSDFDCSEFCKQYGGGGHFHASGFSTDYLIFTDKRDIQESTICINGELGYREAFKKYIKEHSLTKIKGTRCFEFLNDASRKSFNGFEIGIDYNTRKEIPKVDLIMISTSAMMKPENRKNFYLGLTSLMSNRHGKLFLAIILDAVDEYSNKKTIEEIDQYGELVTLSSITRAVTGAGGIVRYYKDEYPIKSIANEVSYII